MENEVSIITYKIRHNRNYTDELVKARKIAEFTLKNRKEKLTSKHVKHFGLKSAISNQIIRKYKNQKNCKAIKSVVLTVPGQSIRYNVDTCMIRIPCLKHEFKLYPRHTIEKVNQIEINHKYLYVACTVSSEPVRFQRRYIGVDLNSSHHIAVAAFPHTGKVWKLGKQASIRKKYFKLRQRFQKDSKLYKAKEVGRREKNIIYNLNHQISNKIVREAKKNKADIAVEDLTGIRKPKRKGRALNRSIHSWSFYQLRQMIEYKAHLHGLKVFPINPYMTSQNCSRCTKKGTRNKKSFHCQHCGHSDTADCNAAFNIAQRVDDEYLLIDLTG